MSFAAEALATAQLAYKNAVSFQYSQVNNRRLANHDIDKLLEQVKYWQKQVDMETAKAAGNPSVAPPIRFNLS